jgi:hypothetical protein
MRVLISTTTACICLSLLIAACAGTDGANAETDADLSQVGAEIITFDLDRINESGLVGPPDGLRSVMYEFCIPGDSASAAEVLAIDSSLELHLSSPGRIGCSNAQTLSIGSTHQPDWRAVLERLAALEYVTRIDETFWE